MEGFAFWQRINDSSESSKNFQTLLDFQRARLSAWAQEWDIGSNNHPKDPRFCMLEGVVTSHLQLIYQVFSGFGTAGIPLPVLDQTRAIVSMDLLPRFIHLGTSSDPYTLRNPDPPTGAGWAFSMDNVKWALQEDKLKDGLALLRTLLNDLYSILPRNAAIRQGR
ncbi:unnamed protein product [Parascedosporium putredinis]|uniref:Prion-inhibition and propagation HeLo domain-containing protein n=1 Tax=Parascedosporium putredinis TaxID=1442378 RepID=A0A9P1GZQ7_9PEZI|nr:unnamed protein product [Parascedosporium putredinis]CAI7993111.1 unnamed protein product [Parascedosporium putredinis]